MKNIFTIMFMIGNVNIQIMLDEITDMQIIPEFSDMPLWKHVYHMLHSMDQWFINPERYVEPDFHEDKMNSLFVSSQKALSKEELQDYFEKIKDKINAYLEGLSDEDLESCPDQCKLSRLTLILGQIRHMSCHMGLIHSFIRDKTGKWPAFLGAQGLNIPLNECGKLRNE